MKRIKRLFSAATASVLSVSSLFVLVAPVAYAAVDTCTWAGAGGDANFSTAANWSGCDNGNIPESGDNLVFPFTATAYTANNDLAPGIAFASILFNGAASLGAACSGYNFTGSQITLAGPVTFAHTGGSCGNPYQAVFTAPVAVSGNVLIAGNTSTTDTIFNLKDSTVTSAGSAALIAQGTVLRVGNIDQSVSLEVRNNSELWYTPADCTNPVIASTVTLGGNAGISVGLTGSGPCGAFTMSNVTLGADSTLSAGYSDVTITSFNPSTFAFTVQQGSATKVISGANTYEGVYIDVPYSANSPLVPLDIAEKTRAIVTGVYGDTTVSELAYLKGDGGEVGNLTVNTGGFLAPGNSPGCLTTNGNLILAGTYEVEVQGADACTGYDQMTVNGTVDLTGGTLTVATSNFEPTNGQTFTIIANDGADPITTTFAGLAEGAEYTANGVTYTISYVGGDGNDVELTVVSVDPSQIPGAPNTGFALLMANPLISLLGGLLAAAGLGILARRQFATNPSK